MLPAVRRRLLRRLPRRRRGLPCLSTTTQSRIAAGKSSSSSLLIVFSECWLFPAVNTFLIFLLVSVFGRRRRRRRRSAQPDQVMMILLQCSMVVWLVVAGVCTDLAARTILRRIAWWSMAGQSPSVRSGRMIDGDS